MQIEVTGRKIELTDSIREKATAAFNKLNDHYSGMKASLIFEKEKFRFRALTEYTCDKGGVHVAEAYHEDLYHAIDLACDKLRNQLSSKRTTH